MAAKVPGLAALFRVLGDETRLGILLALAEGERGVTDVCAALGAPQPTVSHHFAILRRSRLVTHRREGKRIFYRLGPLARVAGPMTFRFEGPRFSLTIGLRDSER